MTHSLPQTGQKFLWGALCMWSDVLEVKERRTSAHLFFVLFSKWWLSCEVRRGHGVSKELFSGRWMGTGDMRWSHPVTICTGVMLVIQNTQMHGHNMTLYADIWTRDKIFRCSSWNWILPCQHFLQVHCGFLFGRKVQVSFFFSWNCLYPLLSFSF